MRTAVASALIGRVMASVCEGKQQRCRLRLDHGRQALDSLIIDRRGTLLFIFVNGRPIAKPQIDRRVSDGRIYIASGLTSNDIEPMNKDWQLTAPRKR
jgi:hypothetical protein